MRARDGGVETGGGDGSEMGSVTNLKDKEESNNNNNDQTRCL